MIWDKPIPSSFDVHILLKMLLFLVWLIGLLWCDWSLQLSNNVPVQMWEFAIFFDREHFTFEKLHYSLFCIQYTFLCRTGWIFISYNVFVTKITVKTFKDWTSTQDTHLQSTWWFWTVTKPQFSRGDVLKMRDWEKKNEVNIKENIATSKQMLICLLSGDANPNLASVSVDAAQQQWDRPGKSSTSAPFIPLLFILSVQKLQGQ